MDADHIVTHRDIAEKVGCDKSTVSLALRGSPKVAEEMGRQIREAAVALGYRPDPAIALLARHRWARYKAQYRATIAYIVERSKGSYRNQKRHFASAHARAVERGYQMTEFDLSEYPNGAAASRVLFHRGISGLIVPAMPREAEVDLDQLELEKFTIVRCSLGWLKTSFHAVAPDVFEGTRLAWHQVASKGYQRIGAALFQHTPIAVDDYARLGASYASQVEQVAPRHRIPFLLSDPQDEAAFWHWFEKHRPQVIISFVERVFEWLKSRDVRVPQDVAVACLNVFPNTPLSGISVQFEEVGRTAVDFLVAQLMENRRGEPDSQQMLLLEPRWVAGRTLPDCADAGGPGPAVAVRKAAPSAPRQRGAGRSSR